MFSFKEWIAENFAESSLLEMAFKRNKVISETDHLSMIIARHMMKVLVYPENRARKSWEKELNAWFHNIQSMVYNRNKRLEPSKYFEILYEQPFKDTNYVDYFVKNSDLFDLKPKILGQQDFLKLKNTIELVYNDLCQAISTNHFTTISSVLERHHVH